MAIELTKERKVLICNTFVCDFSLYFHSHLNNENRDDWKVGLKLDYNYNMLLVRTGHPQQKPMLKLIHSLIEHGIKIKREKLFKESLLLFILYKWISNDERKKFHETKRLYVCWDELISLFKLLSFALILSVCCLIIELLYFFECFKYFLKKVIESLIY